MIPVKRFILIISALLHLYVEIIYLFMRVRVAASIDYRPDNRAMEVRVPAEEIFALLQKVKHPKGPTQTLIQNVSKFT
jgi:hypothetical protein